MWVRDESKSFHNPGFGWLSLYVRLWTGAHSWHDDIFPLTSCGQTNKREKIRNNIGYICLNKETNDIKCKNIYCLAQYLQCLNKLYLVVPYTLIYAYMHIFILMFYHGSRMIHWCKMAFVKNVITLTPHDGVDCDVPYTIIEKGFTNVLNLSIIWCEDGDVLRLYPSPS